MLVSIYTAGERSYPAAIVFFEAFLVSLDHSTARVRRGVELGGEARANLLQQFAENTVAA